MKFNLLVLLNVMSRVYKKRIQHDEMVYVEAFQDQYDNNHCLLLLFQIAIDQMMF
jgi:hypothetical protein